jgi:hypothetical protein
MKSTSFILSITLILILGVSVARAEIVTDLVSVRLMCTATDNVDFSGFDQSLLPGIFIAIIENDPVDARYHQRVVSCALKSLAKMHVPEAVPVLIESALEYTTTCLYWLGTYADASAVDTIVEYLDSEDPSVRYEAASALASLPEPDDNSGDEYIASLVRASDALEARVDVENDTSVTDAIREAEGHLNDLEK